MCFSFGMPLERRKSSHHRIINVPKRGRGRNARENNGQRSFFLSTCLLILFFVCSWLSLCNIFMLKKAKHKKLLEIYMRECFCFSLTFFSRTSEKKEEWRNMNILTYMSAGQKRGGKTVVQFSILWTSTNHRIIYSYIALCVMYYMFLCVLWVFFTLSILIFFLRLPLANGFFSPLRYSLIFWLVCTKRISLCLSWGIKFWLMMGFWVEDLFVVNLNVELWNYWIKEIIPLFI